MRHISHSLLVGALCAALLVTAEVAGPAGAPQATSATVGSSAAASAPAVGQPTGRPGRTLARRPERPMTARLTRDSARVVSIRGSVRNWRERRVAIHQRRCLSTACPWRKYRVVRTGPRTNYRARLYAPRNGRLYWRAAVRRAGRYSWSDERAIGYVYQNR